MGQGFIVETSMLESNIEIREYTTVNDKNNLIKSKW